MSKQKFYLVRDNSSGSIGFNILKEEPDTTKFKFLRMYPSNDHVEEWIPIEEDNLVKRHEKE